MTIFVSNFNGTPYNVSYPFWKTGAAGKAHQDLVDTVKEIGGQSLNIFIYNDDAEKRPSRYSRLNGICAGLKENDVVILSYPIPMSVKFSHALYEVIHQFGAKIIGYIDDIPAWVDDGNYSKTQGNFFDAADGLIVHSSKMGAQIREQFGFSDSKPIIVRGPAGYRASFHDAPKRQKNDPIDFAGSLSKSQFIGELAKKLEINIFSRKTNKKLPNLNLEGSFDPEAIVHQLNGAFGLVWTSESYPEVTGNAGKYEQYNSPNKLSLYLAANEPVIIWSHAAEADFITKQHVGIAIESLDQLPDKLAGLSDSDYKELTKNTYRLGTLIRECFFIKRAVFEATTKVLLP